MELHLMRPEWLWTLVPAGILLLILWRQRGNGGGWQAVIAPELLRHLAGDAATPRDRNLLPLILVAWLLAAVAASGPSWQKLPQPVHQKQDALVLVLDLSYSMKSGDLAPSRLDRARQKLLDLLRQRKEGQTGLVAYAGDAHIVTPLTDDIPTITNLLPALNPDMMPLPGSDPVGAVTLARDLLRSAGILEGKILLVTDGISEDDRRGIEEVMAGGNTLLAIMGVGTRSGAPIPLPGGGFLKDGDGAIVMPGLEEAELRELAGDTGGRYRRMTIDDSDLAALLADRPLADTGETLALDRTADTWEDQGYLLVLLLLPVALALFRRGWLLTLIPCLLFAQPQPAAAQSWDDLWLTPDQQAQRALEQGDSETAASLFENPDWAGTAAYRSGDYESAVEHFEDTADADRLYNRGNALARAGKLDEAIAAYEESLELKPGQPDAQANLELLEQLKEQQQQQQQNQDQQQDGEQQQDREQQQDGDQQQQQQNQDQQQDGEQQQNQDQQQDGEQQRTRTNSRTGSNNNKTRTSSRTGSNNRTRTNSRTASSRGNGNSRRSRTRTNRRRTRPRRHGHRTRTSRTPGTPASRRRRWKTGNGTRRWNSGCGGYPTTPRDCCGKSSATRPARGNSRE